MKLEEIISPDRRIFLMDVEKETKKESSPKKIKEGWERVEHMLNQIDERKDDDHPIVKGFSKTLCYRFLRAVLKQLRATKSTKEVEEIYLLAKDIYVFRPDHPIFHLIEEKRRKVS